MTPEPIPDEVLSACAAGELPPAEAEAVRLRAASDRALAARLAAAERVERALRVDGLLPVPLALLATVIERVRAEPAPTDLASAPGPEASVREHASVGARRVPAAIRRWGVVAATLVVSLGLWAATSGFEPASALGLPTPPTGPSISERLGGGMGPAQARTFDVAGAWAELAPRPASTPLPSILWIAAGIGLLTGAGVLARRFRPLFEAAAACGRTVSGRTASPRTA